MKNTSARSRYLRRQQALAHTCLYAASALLMLVFVGMIAYIVVRGLVQITPYRGVVAPVFSTRFQHQSGEAELLVNHRLRLRRQPLDQLAPLLAGEVDNWSTLSQQDQPVVRVVLVDEVEAQQVGPGSRWQAKQGQLLVASSLTQLLLLVSEHDNAFALVNAKIPPSLPRKLRRLQVADRVLLAAPELAQQSRRQPLSRRQLKQLAQQEELEYQGQQLKLEDGAVERRQRQTSADEVRRRLRSVTGSVVFYPYADSQALAELRLEHSYSLLARNLYLDFFYLPPSKNGKVGGISTVLINTLIAVLLTLLLAAPLSIGVAIYLVEYAGQGRWVSMIRRLLEILAGLPSIIFGLFGYVFFVEILGFGVGLLSGALTLAIMIAPTIIRTSEEALLAVPQTYREGSLALGAQKYYTIFRAVLPTAMPGFLTGVLLGLGRAIGETAAVIFTLGTGYTGLATGAWEMVKSPDGLVSLLSNPTPANLAFLLNDFPLLHLNTSMRTLSVHLYWMVINGISFDRGFQTALLLILFILAINFSANFFMKRWLRQQTGG